MCKLKFVNKLAQIYKCYLISTLRNLIAHHSSCALIKIKM